MNGAVLREQAISVEMPTKNKELHKIKRERKRKENVVVLPYQNEINQVKSKFSDSFSFIR